MAQKRARHSAQSVRRDPRTLVLFVRALARRFRGTLLWVALLVGIGGLLFAVTPHPALGGRPPVLTAIFAAWMALFGEMILAPPATWYLALIEGLYPFLGLIVVGEGVVRFALLMLSRERGEREWMKVMASTYRDHVILCGLGHLGYRVLEQLVSIGTPVVAIERDDQGRFIAYAKGTGVPILFRDMKEDQALIDAGVAHARAIILATNDDMANLEAALDARRLNPRIRIVMRLYDQQIAAKITGTFDIDAAFSSSALAAPLVAAMTLDGRVLGSYAVAGVPHVAAELTVADGGPLAGLTVSEIERAHGVRILARQRPGEPPTPVAPPPDARIAAGDRLVLHAPSDRIGDLGRVQVA